MNFKNNVRRLLNLIGSWFIQLTFGTFFTMGNMNTYIISYVRQSKEPDLTYSAGMWLSTVYLSIMGLAITVGGFCDRKIGAQWTTVIGTVLFSGSIALTYFTIQLNYATVLVTYAMIPAFGNGLAYGVLLMNNAKVSVKL